jgi:homotetrameric cytidine deaminase
MDELLKAAKAAQTHAYAPYSGFFVGAAVRAASGRIYAAANVENAAYPLGSCAEAGAIAAMIAGGERTILEVAVVGSGEDPCTPCGGCRQRLAEFADARVPVHMAGAAGQMRTVELGDLLPLSFTLKATAAPSPDAAAIILSRLGHRPQPLVAIVLGSGMGDAIAGLADEVVIPYGELPGFPQPGVEGHAGHLALGTLAGVPVAVLRGRVHLYEGQSPQAVNGPVRTLKALGCRLLLLTNAAGSLRPDLLPGSMALIADHINMMGTNPLVGANDPATGPRFVDLGTLYDPEIREILRKVAARAHIDLVPAVYAAMLGPVFETPAEIRALRGLGADLVGMSTVPEAISARHCGLRVAALSVVTNLAAGMTDTPLAHEETLHRAGETARKLGSLLELALPEIARATA